PPSPSSFPYTTLFRSDLLAVLRELHRIGGETLERLHHVVPLRGLDGIAHLSRRRPERRVRRLGRQAVRRRRPGEEGRRARLVPQDRKSTRLNSSHGSI